MTVIRASESDKVYWHEVFEELKGRNSSKVLVLSFIAMGEDYSYNIAMQFKNASLDFKALKDPNQLQPILKELEENGFLTSRVETVDGRDRRYYSINPHVIYSPDGSKPHILVLNRKRLEIAEETVHKFLKGMETKKKEGYFDWYFERWHSIKRFDFITFLHFLQEEAMAQKNSELVSHFEAYINEIIRLQQDQRRVEMNSTTYKMSAQLVDPLADQHRQEDERVRAAEDRARQGDLAEIVKLLDRDNSDRVRQKAQSFLGQSDEYESGALEQIIAALIDNLADPSEGVRTGAANALGKIGDIRVVQPLRKACTDPMKGVRDAAKKALEDIGKKNLARLQATSSQ